MGRNAELDFTTLLDELMEATRQAEERENADGLAPSLQIDMLEQIERLQAENVTLFADSAFHEYRVNGHAGVRSPKPSVDAPGDLQPALEDLFFLDPDSISRELGIKARSRPEELDRARRAFAKRYHPDRVPEEFRARAVLRMQIANMLIDEAKRGKR